MPAKMAELKTKKTAASVSDFIGAIEDTEKRKDARELLRLMQRIAGEKPTMWGASIVGFGDMHYRSASSGREGDWFLMGFSPRARNLTVYLMAGLRSLKSLLPKLGQHKTGGSCLYLGRFADIDRAVLESILRQGAKEARALDAAARVPAPKPRVKSKRAGAPGKPSRAVKHAK
jgi:hypothetical protein